jgi:hypothetical protein
MARRQLQAEKHFAPSFRTEDGMQIDMSDEHFRNADFPIRKSLEPDSKMTLESWSQVEKHFVHSASTERGIKIDKRC